MFRSRRRYLLTLILLFFCFLSGLLFFCRGFLLVRSEISSRSECLDVQADSFPSDQSINNCWIKPQFKKAVILVIDALRFDFVQFKEESDLPYHNRLKTVRNLLKAKPENCVLFKFLADAPTTTLQRLKGLTAGNLPTFIDAGKNFAGSEIVEDNFIHQIVRNGKNISFLGDDTWLSLYPTHFHRAYPFPSFDVHDLHTVDNGILRNIYEELARNDWTLLIAHFLGVDHCGHRYGPNNINMALKLDQMDQVIANISGMLDEDTILFVFGDHGMTSTGDHGGDSRDEITAALFAYSKRNIFNKSNTGSTIWQTDIVPTLSLLLDVPIPFSSLGSLIPHFFPESLPQAASANLWQVVRFAEHYSSHNYGDSVLSKRIDPILRLITSMDQEELSPNKCIQLIDEIRSIFRDRWALFNDGWIVLGILTLVQNWLWCLLMIVEEKNPAILLEKRNFLKILSCFLTSIVTIVHHETLPPLLGMLIAFQIVIDIHCLATHAISCNGANFMKSPDQLGAALAVVLALSQFSNSFVVEHARVALFLGQTLILLLAASSIRQMKLNLGQNSQRKQKPLLSRIWLRRFGKYVALCTVLMILFRFSFAFHRCREEQKHCENSAFALSFASASTQIQQMRIFSAVLCLLLIVIVPYVYFKRNGHFVAIKMNTIGCMYMPTLACIFILFHWLCLWLPEKSLTRLPPSAILVPPRLAFLTLFLHLITLISDPLLTHFLKVPKEGNQPERLKVPLPSTGNNVFDFVRANSKKLFSKDGEDEVAVYGLASAVSSYILAILQIAALFLALILGDGLIGAVLILTMCIILTIELFAKDHPSSLCCLLPLLCSLFFYGLGHQPTFTHLPIEAAFVGVAGTSQWRPLQASLIILHCFASHILVVLSVPLVFVWRDFPAKFGCFSVHNSGEDNVELSTANFEANANKYLENPLPSDGLWLKMIVFLGLKMLSSVVTASVHRRHLMVWKIFAPNFIYESVAFIVSFLFLILAFVIFENIKIKQLNVIRSVKVQ